MKKGAVRSFIAVVLLISTTNFGYFYHLCVMKKINKQTGEAQLVIGLADFHDKTHPANKIQRFYIDNSLLNKCVAAKGKIIVEDLSSVNNDGRMNCCNFGINSCEGVLGQLANKARAAGAAVDNVEYRYCRVAGIGPLLNNIKAHPHSFKSSASIKTSSLHKEVIDEIEKIKQYDDGKELNALYKRTVANVRNALSKIAFNVKSTIANYCAKLSSKHYRQELEKLCIFDSALIDMKIMHSIAESPEAPVIFVVAGGSHIEQMSAILKPMGYESVFATSQSTNPTIKKVVNASCDSVSEVLPEPVDITVIDQFIK
jgi:hypothetical protein